MGRKKEPLILEANKRGEMSVALGGGVNVFRGRLETQCYAPGRRGATRERDRACVD